MAEKEIYYIEDDVNEARRAPKIIRHIVGNSIERYDFEKKLLLLIMKWLKFILVQ